MSVYPGKGSAIKISTANGSTVLAAMVQITGITPPQPTNPPVDVTTLDSTWRQFLGTIADGGTFSIRGLWSPDNSDHQRLMTLVAATTPEEYKIVASTTTKTCFFRALVTDFQHGEKVVDDVDRFTANFKVDGSVVFSS